MNEKEVDTATAVKESLKKALSSLKSAISANQALFKRLIVVDGLQWDEVKKKAP